MCGSIFCATCSEGRIKLPSNSKPARFLFVKRIVSIFCSIRQGLFKVKFFMFRYTAM
ncbi:hypothetical protein DICVIV_05874 [Dictyocaulus viviparus]|uniref:Uncharacterized protein n=1 Tax=Dictyocaulus viviparus TaxID=29172 RepID=A0A0D8XW70_DICVI|nr:hypothetical protein DICVIV_05874 [Dictyocaulus viviparus]